MNASTEIESIKPCVLDTRPIFAAGDTPCRAIDEAVAALAPGQSLVLLVSFEPVPLYTKLGRAGFGHRTEQLVDGTWRVEFRRESTATAIEPAQSESSPSSGPDGAARVKAACGASPPPGCR